MIELRATPSILMTLLPGRARSRCSRPRAAGGLGDDFDQRLLPRRRQLLPDSPPLGGAGRFGSLGLSRNSSTSLRAFRSLAPGRRSGSAGPPMRSSGVCVSLVQLPCKSGLPSAVRGTTHLAVEGFWAEL